MYLPDPSNRILLVKRDKIGDLLLTTSLLAHLHACRPDLELHLLANDYNAWVAQGDPAIARMWVYRRVREAGKLRVSAALAHWPLMRELRAQRYGWAVALNGEPSPRATRRALAVRATRTVAYVGAGEPLSHQVTDARAPPAAGHELDRMAALLRPLGIATPASWPSTRHIVPRARRDDTLAWLEARKLVPQGYAVIAVGARFTEKQPTAQQVLRWSNILHERWDLATVFVWTPGRRDDRRYPGDDEIAREVLGAGAVHVHPFQGSLESVAALVHEARTTIAPDSGVMHLAAAAPGGVLGLFAQSGGHDDPQRWHPVGARARWIAAPSTVARLPDAMVLSELASLAAPLAERQLQH
ncbi:MAG: hypothetical protein M3Z31_07355 [Pseudomonadota bacterium]|nr:hypothetical protein [Pseudomonadota bacterium]